MFHNNLSCSVSRRNQWGCLFPVALLGLSLLPVGAGAQTGRRTSASAPAPHRPGPGAPPPRWTGPRNGPNYNQQPGRNAMQGGVNPQGSVRTSNPPNTEMYRNAFGEALPGASSPQQMMPPSGQHTEYEPGSGAGQPSSNGRGRSVLYQFRYNNGAYGTVVQTYYAGWGNFYYPYYSPNYVSGPSYPSPFLFYPGIAPLYIGAGGTLNAGLSAAQIAYMPLPDYNGDGVFTHYVSNESNGGSQTPAQPSQTPGDSKSDAGAGQSADAAQTKDAALDKAIKDIEEAWTTHDIAKLAAHVQKDAKIAVYLMRRCRYALAANDYLDMTRDTLNPSAMTTVTYTLDTVERKEDGIYAVTGKHVYKNERDQNVTVHVSFVLQKDGDEYYITEIGAAPDERSAT